MIILHLIGDEVVMATNAEANLSISTINNAALVRTYNRTTSAILVTQQSMFSNGSVDANVATITVGGNCEVLIEKGISDALVSNTSNSAVCVNVAYRY